MAVTVTDIARRAGVSKGAVSKALNDKHDISQAMKKKIRKLADEMGYSVNIAAKALSTQKTGTIGIVVAFPQIPTVAERIIGIQELASEYGYLPMVTFHNGTLTDEITHLQKLRNRIDGLIITPINQGGQLVEAINSLKMPVVFMNEMISASNTDFVGDDDEMGGRLAAAHLLETAGHNIAYLGNNLNYYSDSAILRGIRMAFEEKNMDYNCVSVYWGNYSQANTRKNIAALLAAKPDIKGIFTFSDMIALWALDILNEWKISVPGDIKLVGYDDIEFAKMARIPLTSISQPNREIGHTAASLLIERLQKKPAGKFIPKKIVFPPTLEIRESSHLK
ncbi:MAG: LacI family DNA-binding transcriptional regulator [Victivallaceae bacterium]|nr:LacI family DNA-binding transcriptional regulator [Victivallaceae bacterium]